MILSHLTLPSRGQIEHVLHMFGYLKKHHNTEMLNNPSEPSVAHEDFKHEDYYSSIYRDIKE